IEGAGEPVAVAMAYKDVAQALYRSNKDVPGMIDAGRRGIAFALDQAAAMTDAPATSARLKEIAWMMSFNLGANTWPGWGDEGIDIQRDQRKAGLDVAMLSLRLAEELSLGATRLGKAYWLVGAHHIANGDAEAALAALDRAAQAFATAG